jgi:DNA repair exonuclease SbcCD ATPase subunit
MNYIKIKRLALENFKCHRNLVLDFNGGNASIYGDNATGKTSVYDALTWLLFGKDSHGNGEKNIEIKPLGEDGEVRDHNAITAVEAVLLVNGEEVTLRRTYQEVWSTKRGRGEATYDGNTSEYYIDGVPVKKYAFSEAVDALVNEDTFRMLTSVSHFADGISWQARREVLFRVANVAGDREIMLNDEKFFPLIEGMGKLSLEDYKKKLLSDKRAYVGAKTDIPARISECQKTIEDVDGMDFGAIRTMIEALTKDKEIYEAKLLSIERNTAAENKRMEIREVQLELTALDNENKAYRASQLANAPDTAAMRANLTRLQTQHNVKIRTVENDRAYVQRLDSDIESARSRWIAVNGESFAGGNCPTCGQVLPAAQLKAATDGFEAQKAKRLREIEQTANGSKGARAAVLERITSTEAEIAELECAITKEAGMLTAAESNVIPLSDIEGYAEARAAIQARITALNGELADIMTDTASERSKLTQYISKLKQEIATRNEYLGKESLLEYSRKRVEELQEDARRAAEKLDAIEEILFLIDEYSRYKTQFVEDSINGMFRIARFRLFREQANGGVEDRCDVVYEGVPYININSGAKINVGIDIINTLSRAYGVTVPLFVDNAESVTNLEKSECQIIRLVVSENDKKLRCDYEN